MDLALAENLAIVALWIVVTACIVVLVATLVTSLHDAMERRRGDWVFHQPYREIPCECAGGPCGFVHNEAVGPPIWRWEPRRQ